VQVCRVRDKDEPPMGIRLVWSNPPIRRGRETRGYTRTRVLRQLAERIQVYSNDWPDVHTCPPMTGPECKFA
jgi:hypothetical protein